MRILACDDEPLALDRISDMVRELPGAHLISAALDSRRACEEIGRLTPDLVLLDVEMPGLDGFDVIESISRDHSSAGAPPLIIFMTAHPELARAGSLGPIAWLPKPVRRARLGDALDMARACSADDEKIRRMAQLRASLHELRERRARLEA